MGARVFGRQAEEKQNNPVIDFWFRFMPHWFNLLGYLALVGAIEFARSKTGSAVLWVVLAISYASLFGYCTGQVSKVKFSVPGIKSRRVKLGVSAIISFVLTVISILLVAAVVQEISVGM